MDGFVRRSEGSPLLSKKPHLYLIGDVADDKEKGGLRYVVATMMGAGAEPSVRRVLAEQDKYPIRRFKIKGQPVEYRENWQKEVKLANEVCQLHDGYEVDRASLPMAAVKPQRSEPGRFRRVTDLHLSADGKQIRTLTDNNLTSL